MVSFHPIRSQCAVMNRPQPPNLAAAAEKFDGAENPPKKNAVGQISAEDKNAVAAGFFSGPFSAVVQKVHVYCLICITVKLLIQFIFSIS